MAIVGLVLHATTSWMTPSRAKEPHSSAAAVNSPAAVPAAYVTNDVLAAPPKSVVTCQLPLRSIGSTVHAGEQPSPPPLFPSSHSSAPQAMPSPHPVSCRQLAEHPSQSNVLPSSQSSPTPSCPLPQDESRTKTSQRPPLPSLGTRLLALLENARMLPSADSAG